MSEFSDMLRFLRKTRGVTQRELAESAGITNTYLSHIEAGRVVPNVEKIERMARYMDADSFELCVAAGKVPTELTLALDLLPADSLRRVHMTAMGELHRVSA